MSPSEQILKYLVKKKATGGPDVSNIEVTTEHEDNAKTHEDNKILNTPRNGIDNDCVRKTTNNRIHNHKKTTFVIEKKGKVKENIKMFQELERGQECVMRSGMCATHNAKLIRSVVKRRMSVVTADGQVEWTMSEGVILSCPLKQVIGNSTAMTSPPTKSDGAIGNKRLCVREDMDQSQTDSFRREDLLLDRTRTSLPGDSQLAT